MYKEKIKTMDIKQMGNINDKKKFGNLIIILPLVSIP